jgi:phage gpG-like protein
MSIKITGKHPSQITADIKKAVQDIIPEKVKQIGLKHFDDSFKSQGWEGTAWAKRKRETRRTRGKALLISSGRLRRSIRGVSSPNKVVFSTDVPYAQIHNEGGTIQRSAMSRLYLQNRATKGKNKGRYSYGTKRGRGLTIGAYSVKMPKRQFVGISTKLNNDIITMIEKELKKAIV